MARLIHEVLAVGPLQCNCVILGDLDAKEAIVVDPGGDLDLVRFRLDELGLVPKAILHTHAHFDHVGSTGELQRLTGAAVYLHEGDLPLLSALGMQARLFGQAEPEAVEVDKFLQDDEVVRVGALSAAALHTPGHTPGSLSFLVGGGPVLSGDTLFAGSIGRTDLWGGDHEGILRSIRDRLLTLDDETRVVPGHGPSTTIGAERRRNPFLRGLA